MNILFIGPLPEPVTGQSLACKVLLDELIKTYDVTVVDQNQHILKSGHITLTRICFVFKSLYRIWQSRNTADIIYLTISESPVGNIKDLLIYLICFAKLQYLVIHLHGGSFKTQILDKYKILRILNTYFLSKIGAVIVLGETHTHLFVNIVKKERLHIVPNFALDSLFSSEECITKKFVNRSKIKILFLSNLITGKGYELIVEAFLSLTKNQQEKIELDFAGAFESVEDEANFLQSIEGIEAIRYHGVVTGAKKKDILDNAQVFCLPSSLLEGQPISILESYAAGCVVVTTARGGIPDIFNDPLNGFFIEPVHSNALRIVFEKILANPELLLPIALHNFRNAQTRYRTDTYSQHLLKILSSVNNVYHY
jgi:glycosyltransferase involved in cell wall biosynthesis